MTAAIHFEVKKHAVRQTADGWVVSFVVHPNDMDSAFAVSPLGTRYMLAVAQIGDDEQPISPAGQPSPSTAKKGAVCEPDNDGPLNPPSPRPAGELQRQRYAAMSPAEQAVTRAAMLPKDERFRAWAMQKLNPRLAGQRLDEEVCADFIREECCNGNSRKLIAEVPEYLDRFLAMETSFKVDVGEIARPR